MPKKLVVYNYNDGKNEIVCAVYTKKQACELLGISLNTLNTYASATTGNPEQLKIAIDNPGQAFFKKRWSNEPYQPYKKQFSK